MDTRKIQKPIQKDATLGIKNSSRSGYKYSMRSKRKDLKKPPRTSSSFSQVDMYMRKRIDVGSETRLWGIRLLMTAGNKMRPQSSVIEHIKANKKNSTIKVIDRVSSR